MRFNSSYEAQRFCNEYSYMARFSLVLASSYHTTSKKRKNEVTKITLRCNKYGKHYDKDEDPIESIVPERQTSILAKTGCKVAIIIKETNGIWTITSAHLEHNHGLGTNSEAKFFRTHKYMSTEEKAMIRTLKKVNIPTRNMVAILSYMRGGRAALPYDDKDVANYSSKVGRERTMNDMTQVLQFFSEKQAENHGFYYSIDMDGSNKVKNIFWADAKAREYYKLYGDCISFDTTFLTNKYNLPFALIVGISAHGNTYIFACAFLGDETADTFMWVFKQFLSAMNEKHPQTVITDQDAAMMKAVAQVFPNARHRICWFHVKKNLEEKNGQGIQIKGRPKSGNE